VVPCFNEALNLRQLLPQLQAMLRATQLRWEIIVVDDGSTDDTEGVTREWSATSGFRCISLSRNFGKEAAITAGLAAATGDAVVLLDGDLQHSPDLIHQMIAQWVAGAEVVYAVREERSDESRFKQLGSKLFYRLVNASDRFAVPKDAGDFRLMDRKVVDALMSLPERSRFMKGLYAWVGFRAVAMPYTPAPRAEGVSSFNARRLVRLALDGLTAFTTWPLRMVSVVGLLFAVPAFAYGIYVTVDHLLFGNAVSGWTTIVVSLMFFIGVQMISTGIVGEYVARIFEEVKGRPVYVVREQSGTGLDMGEA
jgi:glycosyltransferase involved in cell wall biosynthesis